MLAFPFYPILHFWMFKQLGIPIMNFQFSFIGKCPISSLFLKDIIHGHKFLGQWLFLSPRILDVISSTSHQCFWWEVSSNCIIHCVLIIFFPPFCFQNLHFAFQKFMTCLDLNLFLFYLLGLFLSSALRIKSFSSNLRSLGPLFQI